MRKSAERSLFSAAPSPEARAHEGLGPEQVQRSWGWGRRAPPPGMRVGEGN